MTHRFRLAILATAFVAAAVSSAFWVRNSLGTCEILDRWLGTSPCIAKFTIRDIRPLSFAAMVQASDHMLRIFGDSIGKPPLPVQIAFDMDDGLEKTREPLPFARQITLRIIPSLDSDRVAVICVKDDACDRLRPRGYILSSNSGMTLSELPVAEAYGWTFPDEDNNAIGFDGAILGHRKLAVYPDYRTGGMILKKLPGAVEIGRLAPQNPGPARADPRIFAIRSSASGRYVAVINNGIDDPDIGTIVDVWDMDANTVIDRVTTDGNHRLGTNAIWSRDEKHLIALRPFSDGDAGYGADLYILKLRE